LYPVEFSQFCDSKQMTYSHRELPVNKWSSTAPQPRPKTKRTLLLSVWNQKVSTGGQNPFTLLAVTAAQWPNRAAVIGDDDIISYRDLRPRSESVAYEICWHGVGPGQTVEIDALSQLFA
jgi:non-ribosomal peptide synthetase component E (peptide arylation enzyme)